MQVNIMVALRHDQFMNNFARFLEKGFTKLNIKVVAQCRNIAEVEQLYFQVKPDILIMNLKLFPNDYTHELIPAILRKDENAHIIGVTTHYENDIVTNLLLLGARGYFYQTCDKEEIENIVQGVYENKIMIGKHLFANTEEISNRFIH